ncbi:MAG TPA: response regulator [Azospira sp.]|nr:response regulator [Azospira sp.]
MLLRALDSFAHEDFGVRLPTPIGGIDDEIIAAFNAAAETHQRHAEQSAQLERERAEIVRTRAELARRLKHLAQRSSYLPRHLADVSCAQRTLLNNMLILARLLADDDGRHLSPKQIDYAQTIYSAGTQLLALIDALLDQAKAEAGTMLPELRPERFADLAATFRKPFRQLAESRNLSFEVILDPGLPESFDTDAARLRQILWSQVARAFAVAGHGGVCLRIAPAATAGWVEFVVGDCRSGAAARPAGSAGEHPAGQAAEHPAKNAANNAATPPANNAADHRRRASGNGGNGAANGGIDTVPDMIVCRDLAAMLGGELEVEIADAGGTAATAAADFRSTLRLPLQPARAVGAVGAVGSLGALAPAGAVDAGNAPAGAESSWSARARLAVRGATASAYRGPKSRRPDDGVVLIADGDADAAAVLLDLVRNNGYQGEVAGDLRQLRTLIAELRPDALILGMDFAGSDGWTVLDLLRHDPETRQLPVSLNYANGKGHECLQCRVLDTAARGRPAAPGDDLPQRVLAGLNAVAGGEVRRLLLVDAVAALGAAADDGAGIGDAGAWRRTGVDLRVAASGDAALAELPGGQCDAVVVVGEPPDMSTVELMKRIMAAMPGTDLPLAVIGGDAAEDTVDIGVLRHRRGIADLLAETTLFLHRAIDEHPPALPWLPADRRPGIGDLAGRTALIVDDEILDIYAMTGVLEQQGMIVLHAENAAEAGEVLDAHRDIDVVLLGTLRAGLDSHALIAAIRAIDGFAELPIIALTAGTGDDRRERCIRAGASDNLDKPVNVEQLLSLLRAWLIGRH